MRFPLGRMAVTSAALLGAALGIGVYTFGYGEGLSYMSNDPKACVNCHIMRPQYDSWLKGAHHAVATCNDCHVPHDFVGKYMAKASNGFHHSEAFTLEDFHEPIQIKPGNAQILQDNCLRCHGSFVHELVDGATSARGAVKCTHCHANVGHGR